MNIFKQEGLLPHAFSLIGKITALIVLLYAIIVKFIPDVALSDDLFTPNILFLISLILVMSSKAKVEDERNTQIRYYSYTILSGLLVGVILFQEINRNYDSYLPHITSFLMTTVLLFFYLYHFDGDWVERNKGKFAFILISLNVALIFLNDYLWS